MARLIYSAIASLDGYIEDPGGQFEWGEPDAEVFTFLNEQERSVGTYLYGRRMYETMRSWESVELAGASPPVRDFAQIWRAADKVVYSQTLAAPSTTRTRVEHAFDPLAVQKLKLESDRDLTVGGANLAARAIESGLVDEFQLFAVPVAVGGGKPWLPARRLDLELLEARSFASGVVFLRYRAAQAAAA